MIRKHGDAYRSVQLDGMAIDRERLIGEAFYLACRQYRVTLIHDFAENEAKFSIADLYETVLGPQQALHQNAEFIEQAVAFLVAEGAFDFVQLGDLNDYQAQCVIFLITSGNRLSQIA